MEFVSVIIPAFNAGRWLENTLHSVANAIDSECEVIIVNDGSTDNTHDIARRFTDEDPRFILIDIDHVGPCAARKAGFLESQGDYILFVDSDDTLPADAISEQRRLLEEFDGKGANLDGKHTIAKPKIIIANTVARTNGVDKLLISGSTRALTGMEYAREILTRTLPGFLQGHFLARDVVEAIEWDDSPEITHQENFYLLFSFAMKLNEWAPDAPQVLVAPRSVCYHYVRRAGSQSALMALTLNGLERVWRHINKLGLPEPELTLWGLELITRVFVDRGFIFPTSYSVAADLRRRAKAYRDILTDEQIKDVNNLGSEKKRNRKARELAHSAGLTSIRPHLSVIILCRHNVSRVSRTVSSIFAMGFRNLEAIIVDIDNSHSDSLALSNMSIKYARVRIVRTEPGTHIYDAALLGLNAAEGLSVTFARPGDLCCAKGLYDAVTRIDYGADAVLPNYRAFHPLTRLRGETFTYAHLRTTDKARNAEKTAANATENVYKEVVKKLDKNDNTNTPLFIYGIIWRTDFLKGHKLDFKKISSTPAVSISHALLRKLLTSPIQIVTQDKTSHPAFEFANDTFLRRLMLKMVPGRKNDPYVPTTYK